MIDLATYSDGDKFIPMKDVALRQGISLKYLEQILPALTKNKLVEAVHGKGGGYRLAKKPEEITVGDIIRLVEKDNLHAVACLSDDAEPCKKASGCKTIRFWKGLDNVINGYIDSVTLADFI